MTVGNYFSPGQPAQRYTYSFLSQLSAHSFHRDLPQTYCCSSPIYQPHSQPLQLAKKRRQQLLLQLLLVAHTRGDMGGCQSKVHSSLDPFDEPQQRPRLKSRVGSGVAASIESPTAFWSPEPRVLLANRSDYSVSYWVVQEDKKRTTEHLESIVSSIGMHLNVGNQGGSLAGDVERTKEETTHTEEGVYFLMRDHRMGPNGSTQPTQVPFPADCEDVRVYGFFEENGQWQRFKDKVYSIARDKKDFYITALTSNIVPYANKKVVFEETTNKTRGERSWRTF